MAWYRTGTVSVTNGSATVTGSGTAFVANVKVGEEFRLLGGDGYEVAAVVSDTQLILARSFTGTSQSGQGYEIVPIKGFLKAAYDALTAAIAQFQTYANGALAGRFGDGSVGAPAISFLSSTGMGFYRVAANQLGIATNGIRRVLLTTSAMQVDLPITGVAAQTLGGIYCSAGGTANAVTLTYGISSLQAGQEVRFRASQTNTGATTINLDGKGAIACRTVTGVALPAGYIRTDVHTVARYDGTYWVVEREVERGRNANGEYTKLADGTLICTAQAFSTSASADVTWTYPHQFAYPASPGRPAVGGTVSATAGTACFLSVGGITGPGGFATSVSIRAVDVSGARQALDASLIAIGLWY
ncbi:hypothetical protein [Salipiger sp. PrR007]|uniref:hypothetical protein n=1 Tax=Salipiger sp. PrR007 TaxID=2706884 RepID=UPI0013B5BE5A|nr:hypothetical protein [Salipiger sp. PrR007]NDW31886.1 hypothetical protein [Salipiger sp. PrR007]